MNNPFKEELSRGYFETWTIKPHESVMSATQVHGTDIVTIETLPCEADGMIVSWDQQRQPLAIKTADCMPIVIEGENGVVFLHAGWKGLSLGILKKPEISLIKPTHVFIGPCIHVCCFEVSSDFKENFPVSSLFKNVNHKLYFDLVSEAHEQIKVLYPDIIFRESQKCTCCDEKFHSYRRNKTTERNWNLYIKG